jgi:chromatin assembly factor 1 subunit A
MEDNASIDPWGTQYWESETSKTKAPKTVQTSDKTAKMAPPPAPSNAFDALTSHTAGNAAPAAKLVKSEFMDELKQTVEENNTLSKVGIIDFVFQKMRGKASRVEVTNTITLVAERVGKGRDNKKWTIKEGH